MPVMRSPAFPGTTDPAGAPTSCLVLTRQVDGVQDELGRQRFETCFPAELQKRPWGRCLDGDPAHVFVADVVADLEAQDVAIEVQSGFGVGVREEGVVNGDVHVHLTKQSYRVRAS